MQQVILKGGWSLSLRFCRDVKVNRERESAAFAGRAFNPDCAAHHSRQPGRDGQPQAGAPEITRCGAIGLREGFKDCRMFCRWDTDPRIGYAELNFKSLIVPRFALHLDKDFTLRSKLQGVPHQVDKYLSYTSAITQYKLRHVGADLAQHFQSFALRLQCQ